jgi:hypothetical protein
MEVELRYFDDCPAWRTADGNLRAALQRTGRAGLPIRLLEVTSHEQAVALGFRGSPSILLDGEDAFPATEVAVGFACRIYSTPDGPAGSPTVEQLVAALR